MSVTFFELSDTESSSESSDALGVYVSNTDNLQSPLYKSNPNKFEIVWEDLSPEDDSVSTKDEVSHEFKQLIENSFKNKKNIKEGTIITGLVTEISGDYVIVDIGHKSDGEIPTFEFKNEQGVLSVKPGDSVDVYLENFENQYGQLIISHEKAILMQNWDRLSAAYDSQQVIKGKVVRKVKGGLHVDVGVRAFLPGSQIDLRPIKNLDDLVGQDYDFKIIKFNKAKSNVVLSRRVLLEHYRDKYRTETIAKLEVGLVFKGIIKNLTDYGAFVDLGGVDGLLHITDMSWGRVNHPSQLFDIGQELEVIVLSYDSENMRVSLGYKQLQKDPWIEAIEKYKVGSNTKGVVVSLADYGTFIELEDGIEGLIHISEMSWSKRIRHPSKLVSIGDEVDVVILGIDADTKRISLSMKQLEENPWDAVSKKYQVGDVITGKVRNITDFGVFVAVEDGIDALIHVSDFSWTERNKRPAEKFYKGQDVEAKVLLVDAENEKFSLGIKQLVSDPWNTVSENFPEGTVHSGIVSRLLNFGIFVRLKDGFEGLVHFSEMSRDPQNRKIHQRFTLDDELKVVILNIEPESRKISLSIKAYEMGVTDKASLEEYIEKEAQNKMAMQRRYSRPRFFDQEGQASGFGPDDELDRINAENSQASPYQVNVDLSGPTTKSSSSNTHSSSVDGLSSQSQKTKSSKDDDKDDDKKDDQDDKKLDEGLSEKTESLVVSKDAQDKGVESLAVDSDSIDSKALSDDKSNQQESASISQAIESDVKKESVEDDKKLNDTLKTSHLEKQELAQDSDQLQDQDTDSDNDKDIKQESQ